MRASAIAVPFALLLAACQPAAPPPATATAPAASPAPAGPEVLPPPDMQPAEPVATDLGSAVVDHWIGTWTGPEGTSLKLSKQEVGYQVVVTNLDGPREFHGVAAGQALQFERDGVTESVQAADGQATGMKWLADKHDCLVVKTGEGYCRD